MLGHKAVASMPLMSNKKLLLLDVLKETKLFCDLADADYEFLTKAVTVKKVANNSKIFSGGKELNFLYVLKSGLVKLYNQSKASKKQEIVCVIKPGEFFCLSPILTNQISHINSRAIENCELITVSAEAIRTLVRASHPFAQRVIEFLAHKESSLCKDICSLSLANTKERLAKYLLKEYDRQHSASFKLPLNQGQLAAFLGTVREVVSRDLADLRKANIISSNKGQISVIDESSLQKIAKGFSSRISKS